MNQPPVLSAKLTVRYPGKEPVLRGAELEIRAGEIHGLVGQSGSGKSTMALALMRLSHLRSIEVSGEVSFAGEDLMKKPEREMRKIRGRDIALVLQSPLTALNPVLSIGSQFKESWRAHDPNRAEMDATVADRLRSVDLPATAEFLGRRADQLSVGQAQRVLLAMSLLHNPKLLILDEPTSALDVLTTAEVVSLLKRLNATYGTAMLFISHDLRTVADLCNRISILHDGAIVESDTTEQIFRAPKHPYTARLVAASAFGDTVPSSDKSLA